MLTPTVIIDAIKNKTGSISNRFTVTETLNRSLVPLTVDGLLTVNGNIEATGNINYREVTDLLVQDQTITMNYGNASAQDAQIIVDRSGAGGGTNVALKWNETTDKWQFSNDGSTYINLPASTTDVPEGTNLYYTSARTDADIADYTGNLQGAQLSLTGNVTSNVNISPSSSLNANTIHVNNIVADDGNVLLLGEDVAGSPFPTNRIHNLFGSSGAIDTNNVGYNIRSNNAGTYQRWLQIGGEGNVIHQVGDVQNAALGTWKLENSSGQDIIIADSPTKDVTFGNNVAVTGNITASHYIGNGSQLTNLSIGPTLTGINTIESQSGSNISLDSNTKAVKILKDFASVTNQDTLVLDSDGYRPTTALTIPSYSGTGMRRNTSFEGTSTSGSPDVVVTTGIAGFNGPNTTATPTSGELANALANVGTNCMFVSKNGQINTTSPFPVGTRVLSVNAGTNTITMTQNATASATFAHNADYTLSTVLRFGDGAHDSNQTYGELYYTFLDAVGSGSKDVIAATQFTGSTDDASYGVNGPQTADLTQSVVSGTVTVGTYTTQQRSKLTTNKGYTASKYGFTVGDGATLTNRFENDNFPAKGINILHDGQATFSTDFGTTLTQSQYGIKQYSDNTVQASILSYGPRLLLSSAFGKDTDDPFVTYPRNGQSLGQIAWQGTTGKTLTPSSLRPPVYINAIAAEDHSLGANTNVYFGAMSNSDNVSSSNKAHVYLASQNGRTILASSVKGTAKEPIYFAPAQQPNPGYAPQTAYDFSTTAGQQAWATVNYANTSASSGSEIQITNGQSRGAGVVGDMNLKFARANNYVAGSIVTINANTPTPNNIVGPGAVGNSFDTVLTVDTAAYVDGSPVVLSGFTSAPYSTLNGSTKYLKFLGASGGIRFFQIFDDAALTTGFISGGGTGNYGPGKFTYDTTLYSGVTAKNFNIFLEEQSNVLKIKEDGAERLNIDATETELFNRLQLYSLTTTEINALASPQAGQVVYNSTLGQVCVYSGVASAWQKITQATM